MTKTQELKQFIKDYQDLSKTKDVKIELANGKEMDLTVASLNKLEKIAKKILANPNRK